MPPNRWSRDSSDHIAHSIEHSIFSMCSCQKYVTQPQEDIRRTISRPELTHEADDQGQRGTQGPSQMGGGQGDLTTNGPWDPALTGTRKDTVGKLVTSESRWLYWAPHFDQWPRRWGIDFRGHGMRGTESPRCLQNSLGILTNVLKLPKL